MPNKRYDTLEVEEGVYVPEAGKLCPEDGPDKSLLKPESTSAI